VYLFIQNVQEKILINVKINRKKIVYLPRCHVVVIDAVVASRDISHLHYSHKELCLPEFEKNINAPEMKENKI